MGQPCLKTLFVFTREYETINVNATIDFLKAIEAAYPAASKIDIIAHGGSAHTSKDVALFLAVNREYLTTMYNIDLPRNEAALTQK